MMNDLLINLTPSGYVGFSSLPDQLILKNVQKGFVFNIMCIGETGLGKSTLMDSLFNTNFKAVPSSHNLPKVELRAHTHELQEGNLKLKLTIVETAGYGDQINNKGSPKIITDYIDAQFENYLQEELKIKRSLFTYHDTRIHACLYFICPTGHGLKRIDLVCMKELVQKVNLIPIIAKADAFTTTELHEFKSKISKQLQNNDIHIFQPPVDDEFLAEANSTNSTPFAVIGTRDIVRVGNQSIRPRYYPWGTVHTQTESHCDFAQLKELLIEKHMEDLKEKSHCCHYELYRRKRLEQTGFSEVDAVNKPLNFQRAFEAKKSSHLQELQQKEDEMRVKKEMFVVRVQEMESEFREAEKVMHAKLKKEQTEEKKKIENQLKKLEDEIAEFNLLKTQYQQMRTSHHTLTLGRSKKK